MKPIGKFLLFMAFGSLITANTYSQLAKALGYGASKEVELKVVEKVAGKQPEELWQFPSKTVIESAKVGFNLFGAERNVKLARNIRDIEPASIVKLQVMRDKKLLLICPLEYRYNSQPVEGIISCNTHIPSKAEIIMLDETDGNTIWNTPINAGSIYQVTENDICVSVISRDYDDLGIPIRQQVTVLDRTNGRLLWENADTAIVSIDVHPDKNLAVILRKDPTEINSYEYMLVTLGDGKIQFNEHFSNSDLSFIPAVETDQIIYRIKDYLVNYNFKNKKRLWQVPIGDSLFSENIKTGPGNLYLPYSNKLEAIDLTTGKVRWMLPMKISDKDELVIVDGNLYLLSSQHNPKVLDTKTDKMINDNLSLRAFNSRFKKVPLETVDIETFDHYLGIVSVSQTGQKKWAYQTQGELSGNLVVKDNLLYFTSRSKLFALNNETGLLVKEAPLVYSQELSANVISFISDKIVVRNEKYVYCFNKDFGNNFTHVFDLVWPSISTHELQKDKLAGIWILKHLVFQRKYGYKNVKLENLTGRDINDVYARQTSAGYVAQVARLSGASFYSATMTPSYMHAMDATYISNMQSLNSMSQSINASMAMVQLVEASAIRGHLQKFRAHLMSYPFISEEVAGLTAFDNDQTVIRLVSKTIEDQKFIALEALDLATGKVGVQLLSPFQFMSCFGTMYRDPVNYWALSGYVPVVNLKDQVFRTVIDPESNLIFHYGAGMKTSTYTPYDPEKKDYIRGKLICVPFSLTIDKEYAQDVKIK